MTSPSQDFSPARAFLWPIHGHECKKIIPMILIFFFTTFNYNILRNLKDSLIITENTAGAAVIPFIKFWVMLPVAIISTLGFTYLCSRMKKKNVAYLILISFLAFFFVFAFILYPMRHILHPAEQAEWLSSILPSGMSGLAGMVSNWSFTLYYAACELWGTLVLIIIFWGFANEITSVGEAKRFYAIFGVSSNISNIVGGQAGLFLTQRVYNPAIPFGSDPFEQTLMILNGLVVLSGLMIIGVYWWMNRYCLSTMSLNTTQTKQKAKKPKLSFKEQLNVVFHSRYLFWIAVLVLAYNLSMNMVEVVWKDQVKTLYPSGPDYNIYMNKLTIIIGIISCFSGFFLSGQMIRRFGLTLTAYITPLMMLITTAGFFFFFIFGHHFEDWTLATLGLTPIAIAVLFGGVQNALSKACKYTFFDTTKELALIPLDSKLKLQGKAAIDGIGSRFGKSAGSLIHQILLVFFGFGTLTASSPIVLCIVLIVIIFWGYGVKIVGKTFDEMTSNTEKTTSDSSATTPN